MNRKPIFDHLAQKLPGVWNLAGTIPLMDKLIDAWESANDNAPAEPKWVSVLRSKIGEKEIPGSKHNPWITSFWQRLGAQWFNDDETPWCGGAIAWALNEAGLPYPKQFPRAASYKDYGVACLAQVGAIGVKARKGGNHVFEIVGETADKRYYKALGGNQGNMVSVIDILKADVDAIRWPPGVPQMNIPLPVLPRGTIGASEA